MQTEAARPALSTPLGGIPNFRDFGGHPTADGRRVREGLLYRSQAFADATEEDLEQLARIGIRLVCDLRSQHERSHAPGRWPEGADPVRLHLDIRTDARAGYRDFVEAIRAQPDARGAERGMLLNYRGMPAAFAPVLPQLFDCLLDERHLPAVIHCHAGKDRTGFACAMILAALGVDREHVIADYLLSAQRLDLQRLNQGIVATFSAFAGVQLEAEALRPIVEVRAEYLGAALDVIGSDYGGVDRYLLEIARVDAAKRQKLRELLLN